MYPPDKCPTCEGPLVEVDESQPGNATVRDLKIGVQIRGVYDGVLMWQCPHCGQLIQRWDKTSRLHYVAQEYIDHMAGVKSTDEDAEEDS